MAVEPCAPGVTRIAVPVPFPQAGGPVNVYLVEEDGGGVMMFDAGIGSREGIAALEEGFARARRRFDEVTRIVLSHGHVDHYGAAMAVMERAGRSIPVFVHPADMGKVEERGRAWRELFPLYAAHLVKLGVPADALEEIGRELGGGFTLARRIPEVTPLAPGEVLRVGQLALEVLHMPGHTPGLVCLHDRARRILFSGDHLLEKISPNPVIELGPEGEEGFFRPLRAYLASLSAVRALELDVVLPGHGAPFGEHRRVIDGLLQFGDRRRERIREALDAGPLTAFEVTRALFPTSRPGDLFLAVSETIANLEVMEDRREVLRRFSDRVYRFERAA